MGGLKGWENNQVSYVLNPSEESVSRSKTLLLVQVK
jgi:hypothetical protein